MKLLYSALLALAWTTDQPASAQPSDLRITGHVLYRGGGPVTQAKVTFWSYAGGSMFQPLLVFFGLGAGFGVSFTTGLGARKSFVASLLNFSRAFGPSWYSGFIATPIMAITVRKGMLHGRAKR